jgi:citrate synthase
VTVDPQFIPIMDGALEPIAEEIAPVITKKFLTHIRAQAAAGSHDDLDLLRIVFKVATIVHYYRIGRHPEDWLKNDDELTLAQTFLGIRTPAQEEQERIRVLEKLEQQKRELREKGLLP